QPYGRQREARDLVPDDAELLEQIRRGDQAAYRALLNRHARYLFGIAHSLSGQSAGARELLQEALMGALTRGERFPGDSSVRTWLVKILVNRAAMLRRTRSRHPESKLDPASPALPASAGSSSGVEAKLDLSTMLEALSPEHQQVIILRELEGLSYEEMA